MKCFVSDQLTSGPPSGSGFQSRQTVLLPLLLPLLGQRQTWLPVNCVDLAEQVACLGWGCVL
jgi:hypothetical protein